MRERRAGPDLFAEGVGNCLGIFDNRLLERLRVLRGRMQARGFEDGREHCEVEAGHVLRAARRTPAAGRGRAHGGAVSGAEPQGAGSDGVRASGLARRFRRGQRACGLEAARDARVAGCSGAAGEAA